MGVQSGVGGLTPPSPWNCSDPPGQKETVTNFFFKNTKNGSIFELMVGTGNVC